MITKLKYLPVNWMNGMSFSESHLTDQFLAMADSIRDASALHLSTANYGLVGGAYQKKFADSFRDNITNEKIEVPYCRAITQDGSRIEVLDQNWGELKTTLSELTESINLDASKYWYILLIIDPFTRIAEGLEVDEKGPRRKPNTRPAYQLTLMSLEDLSLDNLANAIPLAKFEAVSSGLRKVEAYIPSCTRINSHQKLIEKYEQYDIQLNRIKISSQNIIAKIKHKRRNKENNRLADDIYALCDKYLDFFVSNYDHFKFTMCDSPPIVLVQFFAKLARILNHSLDMSFDKSHMLKYFQEYATDVSESELNRIISATFESNYAHFDLSLSLAKIDKFIGTIDEIFNRLEQLDYRELARRDVVRKDIISNHHNSADNTVRKVPTSIVIKRPGIEENLEDGLKD